MESPASNGVKWWRSVARPITTVSLDEALIDIRTLEVIGGSLPRRALDLTVEWAIEHREELMEDWNPCQSKPAHIHVDSGDGECKYWLAPVVLAKSVNVSPTDVRKIERLVFEHRNFLMEKYHEFHQR